MIEIRKNTLKYITMISVICVITKTKKNFKNIFK